MSKLIYYVAATMDGYIVSRVDIRPKDKFSFEFGGYAAVNIFTCDSSGIARVISVIQEEMS